MTMTKKKVNKHNLVLIRNINNGDRFFDSSSGREHIVIGACIGVEDINGGPTYEQYTWILYDLEQYMSVYTTPYIDDMINLLNTREFEIDIMKE